MDNYFLFALEICWVIHFYPIKTSENIPQYKPIFGLSNQNYTFCSKTANKMIFLLI